MSISAEIFYANMCKKCNYEFEISYKKDVQVYISEICQQRIENILYYFMNNGYQEDAKNLLLGILKNPDMSNGYVNEALVYAWFLEQQIPFQLQCEIDKEDCLKKHSYKADGMVENIVFDIKKFGIGFSHFKTLRENIQEFFPDTLVTVSGDLNIETKEIEKNLLSKVPNIVKKLRDNEVHGEYIYEELGIEIRVQKSKHIITSSDFNEYKWAEKNQYYFMQDGSQFCIKTPYIIICPLDSKSFLASKKPKEIYAILRPFCRRIFINLLKMKNYKLKTYDGKAKEDVSVADAAKKLSAIVFLDVTKEWGYGKNGMWVFCNPNADNVLPEYKVDILFRQKGACIENFKYDNY